MRYSATMTRIIPPEKRAEAQKAIDAFLEEFHENLLHIPAEYVVSREFVVFLGYSINAETGGERADLEMGVQVLHAIAGLEARLIELEKRAGIE